MADNMGGISDAWFAFSMQIASVSQEADKVKVGLKSGDWINLHPGRYGTSIKAVSYTHLTLPTSDLV